MGDDSPSDEQPDATPNESIHVALASVLPKAGVHAELLAMLQTIDEKLMAASVPYWATGGTLLGAVRHRGIIPHDDDVDIELLESDLPRAVSALGSIGDSFRYAGTWGEENVPVGRFYFWGSGCTTRSVDVFLREESLLALADFPSATEIFPLQRLPFHNITVPAPKDPADCLARCYGASWASEAVVWSHSCRRLLRVPLGVYNEAVAASGYREPHAQPSFAESLAQVGLQSAGDLRERLWALHGWQSPYYVELGGTVGGVDDVSLEILQLECRHCPLTPSLSYALVNRDGDDWMAGLSRDTGVFLSVEPATTVSGEPSKLRLRAVGSPEDLDAISERLTHF